jgi:hypothetical protein
MTQSTSDPTTGASTTRTCYTNGVKQVTDSTVNATTLSDSFLETVTKSGSTCYSLSGSFAIPLPPTLTFTLKNAAGTTIATLTEDTTTGTEAATCGGQTYDITNAGNCGMPMPMSGNDCVDGTCP